MIPTPTYRSLSLGIYLLAITTLVGQQFVAAAEPAERQVLGVWQGALEVGAIKLRLVVELQRGDGEPIRGAMDSPDQAAFGLPIDEITVKDRDVKFVMKKLDGVFEGRLSEDGQQLVGKWTQRGATLALTLRPGEKVAPPKRPQEPKPPFAYRQQEVTYENPAGKVKFAGTLTLPPATRRVPAVLLISGSGPQNRDEELLGHKPFLVLADELTRRGVAVLRVDDRGVGGSTGTISESTIDDHVTDALAGVAYLKTRPEVDPGRIGLIGHSEGGLIAPAAAVRSPDVAFIVMLAGPGLTGEEIIALQGELIAKAAGAPALSLAINRILQKKLVEIIKRETDNAAAGTKLDDFLKELSAKPAGESPDSPNALEQTIRAQWKQMTTPWFRHFLTYDPRPALEKVRCPVLALNGELDLQVPPKNNLPVIEAALKAGGNSDATVRELPTLNHLFQACKTGAPSEYGQIEETFNPAALKLIGDWIVERFGKE